MPPSVAARFVCPQVDLYALQLILQCSRACPQLCQAAVLANTPDALLRLRDGANGSLALLALTAVLEGLHARRGSAVGPGGTAAAAAQSAMVPGPATDDAIRRLAGNVNQGLILAKKQSHTRLCSVD